MSETLELCPMDRSAAYAFIDKHHRHLGAPKRTGYKFAIGLERGGVLIGCAVVGKPQSRMRRGTYPYLAEVTRLCTDGTPHASSKLYAACWRAVRAMGFRALGTYTLETESGVSLRAAGYRLLYTTKGGTWNRRSRPRLDVCTGPKQFWLIGTELELARSPETG